MRFWFTHIFWLLNNFQEIYYNFLSNNKNYHKFPDDNLINFLNYKITPINPSFNN